MSNAPRGVYFSSQTKTVEQACDVRARAWMFVFDCYANKKAAPESRPDDVRKDQDAHTATKQ